MRFVRCGRESGENSFAVGERARLLRALAELIPPSRVGQWLREPNEGFDGQTPMQVVERGEADRLWQMIHQVDANVAN